MEYQLEKYEWEQLWWDNADAPGARVLLIGDSITNGSRDAAAELLAPDWFTDKFASSRGPDNPAFLRTIDYMLSLYAYDVIHLSNGLHAGYIPADDFGEQFDAAVRHIMARQPRAKLVIATATPVTVPGDDAALGEFNDEVVKRNAGIIRAAEKRGLPVDDLYSAVLGRPELRSGDGYHYNDAGWKLLGRAIADSVRGAARG